MLIPQSKLGNVVKPSDFKLKERTGSVLTPGKIIQVGGQGKLDPTKLPPIVNTGGHGKGPLDPTKVPPILDPRHPEAAAARDRSWIPPRCLRSWIRLLHGSGHWRRRHTHATSSTLGRQWGRQLPPKDNCHNNHCHNYPWPIFLGSNYWNKYGYGQSYCQPSYSYGSTPVISQSVAIDTTTPAAQPVAAAVGSGDLILEDVILAEPATALVDRPTA